MYQKGQLSSGLVQPTSGTEPSLVATRLGSLRPAYLYKCDENSDSIDCAGCTEMITSLDKYAIRATIPKGYQRKERRRLGDGGVQCRKADAADAVTYRLLQQYESCTLEQPYFWLENPSTGIESSRRRENEEE